MIVEADGGSRGNPGPAAYGAVIRDPETSKVLAAEGLTIGRATNNVAEYRGLIAGLEMARELDSGAALEVRSSRNIPEHFTLALRADRQRIPCHIVWRNEERLGVAFDWLT